MNRCAFVIRYSLVAIFSITTAHAQITLDNGQTTVVDTPQVDRFEVRDSATSDATTLQVADGGTVTALGSLSQAGVRLFDKSVLEVDGGIVSANDDGFSRAVVAFNDTTVNLLRGEIRAGTANDAVGIDTFNNAVVNIFGGEVVGGTEAGAAPIQAEDRSVINIFGGVVRGSIADAGVGGAIELREATTLNLHGGEIIDAIGFEGQGFGLTLTMGTSGFDIREGPVANLFGTSFLLDGQPVAFGELGVDEGELTVNYLGGESTTFSYRQNPFVGGGTINLIEVAVPEPTGVCLALISSCYLMTMRTTRGRVTDANSTAINA